MSHCINYKEVTTINAAGVATSSWFDITTSPWTLLPAKPADAVPCVDPEYVDTDVCLTPTNNITDGAATDPTLVVKGKCIIPVYRNCDGTTDVGDAIFVAGGTDVTATHGEVHCPVTTTVVTDHCKSAGK